MTLYLNQVWGMPQARWTGVNDTININANLNRFGEKVPLLV